MSFIILLKPFAGTLTEKKIALHLNIFLEFTITATNLKVSYDADLVKVLF